MNTQLFIRDVYNRMAERIQLTTDAYMEAGIADHVWSLAELLGVQQHAI